MRLTTRGRDLLEMTVVTVTSARTHMWLELGEYRERGRQRRKFPQGSWWKPSVQPRLFKDICNDSL